MSETRPSGVKRLPAGAIYLEKPLARGTGRNLLPQIDLSAFLLRVPSSFIGVPRKLLIEVKAAVAISAPAE